MPDQIEPIHVEGAGYVRPLTREDTIALRRGGRSDLHRLARSVDMTIRQFKALPEETREQVRLAAGYLTSPTHFGPAKVKPRRSKTRKIDRG